MVATRNADQKGCAACTHSVCVGMETCRQTTRVNPFAADAPCRNATFRRTARPSATATTSAPLRGGRSKGQSGPETCRLIPISDAPPAGKRRNSTRSERRGRQASPLGARCAFDMGVRRCSTGWNERLTTRWSPMAALPVDHTNAFISTTITQLVAFVEPCVHRATSPSATCGTIHNDLNS